MFLRFADGIKWRKKKYVTESESYCIADLGELLN